MTTQNGAFAIYRDCLISHLKSLDIAKTVRSHSGQFGQGDLTSILANAPALHVAILAARPAEQVSSGGVSANLKVSVFIVTRDIAGATRDTEALRIAAQLFGALDRWQATSDVFLARPAYGLAWQNLYNAAQGGTGNLLSAVSFDAVVSLPADFTEPVMIDQLQTVVLGDAPPEGLGI